MRAFLVLVVLLAGCAPDGVELTAWKHRDRTLELPGNARFGGLPSTTPYTLSTRVMLTPSQRGQPLTLSLECVHGVVELEAAGRSIVNIGDSAVGEHRFLIPAELTASEALELELTVRVDVLSVGISIAPRLSTGSITTPSGVARFNRYAAIVDLAVIAIFAILFGLSYMLDRRRKADAAFTVGALLAAVAPLAYLGFVFPLGPLALPVVGISICGANLAVLYFLHASFELGPMPRRLVQFYWWMLPLAFTMALATWLAVVWNVLHFITDIFFLWHVVGRLLRQARSGAKRFDAALLLVMILLMFGFGGPDLVGLVLGHGVFGGIHVLSLGALAFAFAQALHLAREQVTRQQALERTTEELRRQVAERSRELADALSRLAQQPKALEADRTIDGRYRVIRKLGAGGMGAVYEVERLSDKQRFALKTLRGRADTDLMARFAREAQIAAEISHPNLVPVLDVGISDDGLFLVMPLISGGSLEHARSKFGDASWAKPLLRQIAEGLAALHGRDIVHRDLKPGNVLVVGNTARIADFGLAALRVDTLGETLPSSDALADTAADVGAISPLTQRGDIFGTPGYMAPELAAGSQDAKPSSDIFAFGVIAFEMLMGKPAFLEPPVIARLHGRAIPVPVVDALPATIGRCLDLEPARRPTAAELVAALA